MKSLFYLVSILLVLLLASCSTDVDNYADYKDITIVYGLLEPGPDTSWIKINKAFLGPGNALLIARDPDSSNYSTKLDVKLKGRRGNNDLPVITLDTITIRNKKAGDSIFYFPNQLMYYTTANILQDAVYTLEIGKGNEVITAQTRIVNNFPVVSPVNRINFHLTAGGRISWNTGLNGKRYEVNLVFHYKELRPTSPDTLYHALTWRLGTRTSTGLAGGESLEVNYIGNDFYTRLGQQLDDILNVKRWAGPVDVVIGVAGDDLNTYIEVNAPSNSIIQEIPEFSNIENGFGIFSSRFTKVERFRLAVGSEIKLVEDFNWGFIVNR
jgi:hypothetical protein